MSVRGFRLSGMCAGAMTPLKEGGDREIDISKIKDYIEHIIAYKATIVFVTGTISEGIAFNMAERKKLMKIWTDLCKGRLATLHHIGTSNLKDSKELARYAEEIGADAITCTGPSYFKPMNEEAYVDYMQIVAAAAPNTPFYLYANDAMTGINLDVVKFFEIAMDRIPTLVGAKVLAANLPTMHRILMVGGKDRFQVLYAGYETYLEAVSIGVEVPAVASYTLPTMVRIRDAVKKGDLKSARMEQYRLLQLHSVMAKYRLGHGSPAVNKAIMKILDVDLGPPRLPTNPLPKSVYDNLDKDLKNINFHVWAKL